MRTAKMVGARDGSPLREINPSSTSGSDVQSPSSLSYDMDINAALPSLHPSRINSRDSLLSSRRTTSSRCPNFMKSTVSVPNAYFQVDDLGVYLSTVAIRVVTGIVVAVAIILVTIVVTLALEVGKYQKHPRPSLCASYNLNAEINNLQGSRRPPECASYIAKYVTSGQYSYDFAVAVDAARQYLNTFKVNPDGRDLIVLDIDETCLSTMPYYAAHQWGMEEWNQLSWIAWVNSAMAPALEPMLSLYTDLRARNWSVAFITGRSESMGPRTALNLHSVGYTSWTTLIFRSPDEEKLSAVEYKSKYRRRLTDQGYRIRSSLGDQWSDLMGENTGIRTFKMPNPMYYVH